MRKILIFTAPWYPGHAPLLQVVKEAELKLEGKDVELEVVDVDEELSRAEENVIVGIPTAVLFKDDAERRRLSGAIGLPELLGLAGIKTRQRKVA